MDWVAWTGRIREQDMGTVMVYIYSDIISIELYVICPLHTRPHSVGLTMAIFNSSRNNATIVKCTNQINNVKEKSESYKHGQSERLEFDR